MPAQPEAITAKPRHHGEFKVDRSGSGDQESDVVHIDKDGNLSYNG